MINYFQPERLQTSPRSQEVARVPTDEISSLSNCYWYWGPLSRIEAEDKLKNCPDGAFLIRDSSSSSYLFSISFRSVGKTLHTRIEHTRGKFQLVYYYMTALYFTIFRNVQSF